MVENGIILQKYCMLLLQRTHSDSSKCFSAKQLIMVPTGCLCVRAAYLRYDMTSSQNLTRSPDSSSLKLPRVDTVMICNAADGYILTQQYAIATSSD